MTQPTGIEAQPTSIVMTFHQEQSIVTPVGINPNALVIPLLAPIAMSTNQSIFNGTLPP